MKKFFFVTFFSVLPLLWAFDYPQEEIESDSFHSYFAQLRGGTMSSSLVFNGTSKVKAAESGEISIIISEHGGEFGWFESTLGNAIIIQHKDGLSTVYGNLEEGTIPESIFSSSTVKYGEFLGMSGNSGWQDRQSCLEFKVFDKKNLAAVNPRILLPRIDKEPVLLFGTLSATGKDGINRNFAHEKTLKAGIYSLYKTYQEIVVPYKTIVAINGVTVETISYEMLKELNGKLCVQGNSFYSVQEIYPQDDKQLLAIIQLLRGTNIITVRIQNILGTEISATYNIDTY